MRARDYNTKEINESLVWVLEHDEHPGGIILEDLHLGPPRKIALQILTRRFEHLRPESESLIDNLRRAKQLLAESGVEENSKEYNDQLKRVRGEFFEGKFSRDRDAFLIWWKENRRRLVYEEQHVTFGPDEA